MHAHNQRIESIESPCFKDKTNILRPAIQPCKLNELKPPQVSKPSPSRQFKSRNVLQKKSFTTKLTVQDMKKPLLFSPQSNRF